MVDELRALVLLEREEAVESERLRRLDAEVAEVRARAEAIIAFFATEPAEHLRLGTAEQETLSEVQRRDGELAAAEEELDVPDFMSRR